MATDVSIRLGVTGERDLTAALKGVESRIKNLNAEMKAAVSSMAGMDSAEASTAKKTDILGRSVEAAKEKIGILSQQYDKAKAKLDQLGNELDQAKAAFGENSAEALKAEAAFNRQASTVNHLGAKLNNATADLNRMEAELRDVDSAADKAGNSFQQLEAKISAQENELKSLKTAYSNAVLEFGKGSKEAAELGNKIDQLSSDLKQSKTAMKQAADAADELDNSLSDAGDGADGFLGKLGGIKDSLVGGAIGGAISGLVQSAISGIQSLVQETMEYQKIMGVLEASSQKAGYTADQTAQSYRQLYQVIGEDQASATALANLQALGLSQSDLTTLIDGTIGAWATYGDSIPIDSLSEAINETIQAGTVTGTFADVLNWAGTSEDAFNQKLQATKDPAERAKLVLEELAQQGLPQLADAFREANPEIVAMNDAQAHMQESMGKMGEAFAPVVAAVTDALAGLMEAFAPVGEAFSSVFQGTMELLQPVIEGLKERFQDVKDAINNAFTPEQQAAISNFFETLGSLILAAPFAVLSAAINIVVTAIELLIQVIGALVGFFSETLPNAIQTAVEWISQLPGKISSFFSNVISTVSEWVSNMIAKAAEVGGNFLSSIGNFFGQLPGRIGSFLSNALSTVAGWVSNMIAKAREVGSNVLSTIGNFFGQIPGKIASLLSSALSALVSWASNMVARARDGMNNVKNTIVTTLQSIPGKVISVGRNIVEGLWNGISGAASWLLGKIKGWCGSILNGIKGFFGIASPSWVMRDQVGLMIARGLAKGIQKGEKEVLHVADTLNQKLLDKEEALTKQLEETGLDEATKEALTEQLNVVKEFRSEYEKALEDIQKSQDSMAQKLKDYGDLFQTVKTETGSFLELNDLEAQLNGIERYGEALEALKARGVSDSLLDEIVGMNVEDATAYTEKLLAMTDDQYTEYMALWQRKQQEAQAIAQTFYQDEMDALGKEFVDKIPQELGDVKDEMRSIGVQGIQGMIDGMYSRSGALWSAAASIVSQAIAAMRAAADINSPSRVTENLVGKPLAQGIEVGFLDTMARVSHRMADTILTPFQSVTRGDLLDAAAGVVNGNAGLVLAGAGTAQTIVIPVQLNGKQIAEVVYDPLKQVGRQRGD